MEITIRAPKTNRDLISYVFKLVGTGSQGLKPFGKGIFVHLPKKEEPKFIQEKEYADESKKEEDRKYVELENLEIKYTYCLKGLDGRCQLLKY